MFSLLPIEINLWNFCLHQYSRPGVSELCLRLQDDLGINVNIVLWGLWLGHRGQVLDSNLLAQAGTETHHWNLHYVMPLRALRRQIKAEFGTSEESIEAVRAQIKQAELLAEKHLLQKLEKISVTANAAFEPNGPQLMMRNLKVYLAQYGVTENQIAALVALLD